MILKFKNAKGLTVLELLIVASVGAVAGFLLISSLIQSNDVFFRETGRVQEGLSLNQALITISKDIKSASKVSANYPESGQAAYQTSQDELVLKISSIDWQGRIIENTFDYIIVHRDFSQPFILLREVIPTPPSQRGSEENILLKNLKNLSFFYLDKNGNTVSPAQAEKINFYINTQTKFGLNSQVSSSSSEVNLRND